VAADFDDAFDFSEGMAVIKKGRNHGYIDKQGKVTINPPVRCGPAASSTALRRCATPSRRATSISAAHRDHARFRGGMPFSESLARVRVSGRWGYIDANGKLVIQPQFDDAIGFPDGLAGVKSHGEWGYIDKTGRTVWAADELERPLHPCRRPVHHQRHSLPAARRPGRAIRRCLAVPRAPAQRLRLVLGRSPGSTISRRVRLMTGRVG
jgi:hypothetical protein